jgi:hypothetical protein
MSDITDITPLSNAGRSGYITAMAVDPETTVRKLYSMPRALAKRIDDFRFRQRIKTEAEAVRLLIERGLEAESTPKKKTR